MSVVTLLNVNVRNNPAAFTDSYEFEITFECLEPLAKDLEWKLTYVGSATSSEYDQELDSLLVGPVPVGTNKFLFQANAPSLDRIPPSEILGVTVILLSCAYDDREFVRVGYYVNNEYADEALNAEPPAKPVIEKVRRNILAEKPRVTRFGIKWDSEESAPAEYPPEQPEADVAEDDEGAYGAEEVEEAEEVAAEENGEASNGVKAAGEDAEMGGADETAGTTIVVKEGEEEEEADDGNESEDIEGESEDEEEDEEEGEEGDEMEMAEGDEKHADGANGKPQQPMKEQPDVVMAH